MLDYKIKNAEFKDIEILTSMKMVTMIDDEMDKVLSYEDKNKIKKNIVTNIQESYKTYKMIYIDKKIAGAYSLIPYLDGEMVDQIYVFPEYRNNGIGTDIISKLQKRLRALYIWSFKNNKQFTRLIKRLNFEKETDTDRTVTYKFDSIDKGVVSQLNDIRLGYRDKNGNAYISVVDNFRDVYYLQSPEQVMQSKIGLCFDQVELERKLFTDMNVEFRTYYMIYQGLDVEDAMAHTFLVYKDNEKYYWLEHAWLKYRGIHEYNSKEELLLDVAKKFVKTISRGSINRLKVYQYDKPRYGINYAKYISNAMNGTLIKLK